MLDKSISINYLNEKIQEEKKVVSEIASFFNYIRNSQNPQERKMISSQLNPLIDQLKKSGQEVLDIINQISLTNPLNKNPIDKTGSGAKPLPVEKNVVQANNIQQNQVQPPIISKKKEKLKLDPIERLTIKRLKKKDKKVTKKKEKKPSVYAKLSSQLFYDFSMSLIKKDVFRSLRRDLVRGNIDFAPAAYISTIFFSTLTSFFVALFIVGFLLFFTVALAPPFVQLVTEETIISRFVKFSWILILLPLVTFLFKYSYPSLEKKNLEAKLNRELPFATIHMSAISNSMIEPSKIFEILITTGEYPNLSKELVKLKNEINIYGYDLVTALRNRSFNSPSRKLSELLNGLATTITSGGNLPVFFDKRSQSLLFEYRLEQEKEGKAAETFMDIYISVVIAAPMVLMLLLMMMSISGLGISLGPGTISLIMILGVSLINILFLGFLQLKQPSR